MHVITEQLWGPRERKRHQNIFISAIKGGELYSCTGEAPRGSGDTLPLYTPEGRGAVAHFHWPELQLQNEFSSLSLPALTSLATGPHLSQTTTSSSLRNGKGFSERISVLGTLGKPVILLTRKTLILQLCLSTERRVSVRSRGWDGRAPPHRLSGSSLTVPDAQDKTVASWEHQKRMLN